MIGIFEMILQDAGNFIYNYLMIYIYLVIGYNLIYSAMKGFVGMDWTFSDVLASFLFPLSIMNGLGVMARNILEKRKIIKL